MRVLLSDLARYDCLYVSPHEDDAPLACAGRILWERARGLRVLVTLLFGEGEEMGRWVSRLGVDYLCLRASTSQNGAAASDLMALDCETPKGLPTILDGIGRRTRARHVYIPLGVGKTRDHQLGHEAGLLAFPGEGRDVFLYEERPEALVPGAIRVRLAQLGARLPPGAAEVRGAGLLRFLICSQRGVRLPDHGWLHRLRSTRKLAGEWYASRAWDSQKAFGPRLQPVLQTVEPEAIDIAQDLARDARLGVWFGSAEGITARALRYSRGLGGRSHVERYWLVLPSRDSEGLTPPLSAAHRIA